MKPIHYFIIAAIILFFLWLKGCGTPEPTTRTITIKETVTKYDTIYEIKHVPITRTNTKLVTEYIKADTIVKLEMYADAVAISEYSNTFEDSLSKVEIGGQVQGKVLSMYANVTVKERSIEVPAEKKRVHLLGGVSFSTDATVTGLVGLQNKRGNIILGGYDTRQNWHVGYVVRVW